MKKNIIYLMSIMYTLRNLLAFKALTFQTFYYVFICKHVCVSIHTHILIEGFYCTQIFNLPGLYLCV